MLMFEVEGILCAYSLHLGFSNVFLHLWKRCLNLESLSLRERKFDLRESLLLGGGSFLLGNDFFSLVGILQNKQGRGIEKSPLFI